MLSMGAVPVWVEPLWQVALGAVAALAALVVVYGLIRLVQPAVGAIVYTTSREGLAQPLFYVLLFVGTLALLAFPFLPYNTFGEDVKMLKTSGLTLIMVLAIVLALWTASVSIADEIEGRTALTLLSKPIRRWQFIVGKFLGILGPVAVLFILLGALFLATVSFKVVYDARESSSPMPTGAECLGEMVRIVPGLVLYFLQVVVLTAISVAISTRLPMLANLIICSTIYVLGNLMPLLVQSGAGRFAIVEFMGYLIATVLPVLEYFNVEPQVMAGSEVPIAYIAWVAVYSLAYSSAALLVALLLFEERDLA